jgi:hypothetical protein
MRKARDADIPFAMKSDASPRRNRIAYQVTVQRVGDYGFRAATTRLAALAVIAATLISIDPPWYAWLIVIVGVAASYLSASDNYYTEHPASLPREPLARASLRYSNATLGKNRPNFPGLAESACYVPLGVLGAWLLTDQPVLARLICVGAALVYIGSCLSAVFVDPAFYNPRISMPSFIEMVRACVGPLSAAIAAAVIVPAPWPPGESRWIALGMCLGLVGVQLRLRETDRAVVIARTFSDGEQLEGRKAVTDPLHSYVGAPLNALRRYVERNREHDPELYDQYRVALGYYRSLIEMDLMADVDVDWPGLLNGRLRQLLGARSIEHTFTHTEHPLSRSDRFLAHLLLDEFVANAIKADAAYCEISLDYDVVSREYRASVVDDGEPILEGAWMRTGGGLERLAGRVAKRGGVIARRTEPDGRKIVEAYWESAEAEDGSERSLR